MKQVLIVISCLVLEACGQNDAIGFPRSSDGCVTIDGANAGSSCVFPFIFGDTSYNECIIFSDPDQIPWCSTKVDETGTHIAGGGFWGHCSSSCPGAQAAPSSDDTLQEHQKLEEELTQEKSKEEIACTTSDGRAGHCNTPSLCIDVTDDVIDASICPESRDANGQKLILVCCPDVLENNPPLASLEVKPQVEVAPTSVTLDDIRSAFNTEEAEEGPQASEDAINFAPAAPVEDDEEDVDPAEFLLRFNQASTFANEVSQAAKDLLKVTNDVKDSKNLTHEEAGIGLRFFDSNIEDINVRCPWTPDPTCTDQQLKYRTFDGSCNNLQEPNYGRAGTPLQRILEPSYGDTKFNSPRTSVKLFGDGLAFELPSARTISNTVTSESNRISGEHTALLMQMGQFIDHDITHTPTHSARCCNSDGSFPESFDTEKCYPILIPSDDPFWKGRKTCMSFARSLAAPTLKCSLEFQQQMNQISHWMDASSIYGSSADEAEQLRERFGGLLKMDRISGTKLGVLPSCSLAKANSRSISMCSGCSKCFYAGDSRANEQLNLLSMHTIWAREHNRIARFLAKLNPSWDDERIYQETRKIVIAEYQHIVFKEWLPIVVGNQYMTNFGLWPLSKGYSTDYYTNFDPRVTNEFSTAAFRFGHSLVPKQFDRISPRRIRQGKNAAITARVNLREIFFKPQQLLFAPSILDELVAGLATQESNLWDNSFVPDIRDHLFESSPGAGGLDLVALNIQRGRDHGIKGYNYYREVCSIGRAKTWEDFHDLIEPSEVDKLRQMYADIDDVDLFVGGFLERPDSDAILGPVFRCIVGDTFARLKLGDRFFYDLNLQGLGPNFTEDQLTQIRKTSMARILCDNTENLEAIQPQAFKLPGSSSINSVQFCSTSPNIPRVNLGVFRDESSFSR